MGERLHLVVAQANADGDVSNRFKRRFRAHCDEALGSFFAKARNVTKAETETQGVGGWGVRGWGPLP